MNPAQVIAFVTFSAVVAGTPGPSNALLTAVGANAGVRRGLPSLLGQVAGMGAMLFAITLGLGNVLLAHPLALEILKWGGAAMLCWMAWRIATAGSAEGHMTAPTGFFGMAAFQWVNPKGWLGGGARGGPCRCCRCQPGRVSVRQRAGRRIGSRARGRSGSGPSEG